MQVYAPSGDPRLTALSSAKNTDALLEPGPCHAATLPTPPYSLPPLLLAPVRLQLHRRMIRSPVGMDLSSSRGQGKPAHRISFGITKPRPILGGFELHSLPLRRPTVSRVERAVAASAIRVGKGPLPPRT